MSGAPATSRKAREVAHPQLFRSKAKDKPASYLPLKWPTRPKLPPAKPRRVIQLLEKNGFILDHTSGSHFIFYNPVSRRRAVVLQHNRDLPNSLW